MTATEELIAKQVSDVFPASVDDLPLADAARRGLIAPLRCLRVPPVAAINSVPIVGGDFDQEAPRRDPRPPGAEPGRRVALPRPLRQHAGDRLRGRRRARVQPRAGVPRRRHQGRGRLRPHAAGQARRDARRLRARRDQRPDQRDAARRGLELAARDRRHAPRADGLEARLPAADRPDHAHAPAQGGGHRRRLRRRRARPTTSASSRCTRCSTPTSTARAPASRRRRGVGSSGARGGRLTPAPWLVPVTPDVQPPPRRDPARVAARRPEVPRRGRAAVLGHDRGPHDPLRRARGVRRRSSTERRRVKAALEQFLATCAAENPNRRLRMIALADRVSMTVERADFDDLVTLVTQAPTWEKDRAAGVRDPAAGDRRGQGRRARPDPRALDVAARRGDAQGPGPARVARVSRRRSGCSARSRTRAATGTRRTPRSS